MMMTLAGVDPYDALKGRRIPDWVRSRRRLRQAVIQLRKRFPIDLTSILGVEPFVMAKAVACFLTAEVRHSAARDESSNDLDRLVRELHHADGCLGGGAWGYEFDVQTRWGFYPAGEPNLIATAFCGRALLTAGVFLKRDDLIAEGVEAARYLAHELHVWDESGRPFFRYTHHSTNLIHNANALGSALVAMAGAVAGDRSLVDLAQESMGVTLAGQRPDGTWPYGADSGLSWNDSFHTAYILDSLHAMGCATGDPTFREVMMRGIAAWTSGFFGTSGQPYYYMGHRGPLDIHAAATAVDVAARLKAWKFDVGEVPGDVAKWTSKWLVGSDGVSTCYRKHAFYVDRRHFVRWGDAHWALGRSSLELLHAGHSGLGRLDV
jgi:hypothetical protein